MGREVAALFRRHRQRGIAVLEHQLELLVIGSPHPEMHAAAGQRFGSYRKTPAHDRLLEVTHHMLVMHEACLYYEAGIGTRAPRSPWPAAILHSPPSLG